jgi:hypothetical protein
VLALVGLSLSPQLGAAPTFTDWQSAIPDNAWARQYLASLLTEPVASLKPALKKDFSQVIEPREVRFRIIREEAFVYLVFQNRTASGWPDRAPGNAIIRRAVQGGGVDQVKLFLANSPDIYLRITKDGTSSLLSVFFADNARPLYRDLPIPLPIERVALTPTATILKMTNAKVVWSLFMDRPPAAAFAASLSMVERIRAALPTLPDADDGAMDENGNLVGIGGITATGQGGFNCSGFAKWVADGLYRPLTAAAGVGKWLTIGSLSKRLTEVRGSEETAHFEESRDPWFGLDWIRNIAWQLAAARLGHAPESTEDWDVRRLPFLEYTEDKGYPVAQLEEALYLAALKEPGTFYMAAVNGEFGKQPVLWQFYHILVLFPYFDAAGAFRCAVFERNRESTLAGLPQRYPKEYAHLVRIRASRDFDPPRIK